MSLPPLVLVADRDPQMCRVLTIVLPRWGFECRVVESVEALAKVLESQAPEFVILDPSLLIGIPEVLLRPRAGLEIILTPWCRSLEPFPTCDLPASVVVTKPYRMDALMRALGSVGQGP